MGGVFFPYFISGLLSSVGFAWTLRIFSLFFLLTLGPATYFARPRVQIRAPVRETSGSAFFSKQGLKGVWQEFLAILPKAREFAFVLDANFIISVSSFPFWRSRKNMLDPTKIRLVLSVLRGEAHGSLLFHFSFRLAFSSSSPSPTSLSRSILSTTLSLWELRESSNRSSFSDQPSCHSN